MALGTKDYRLFLSGFFVSQMGSQMQMIAINWQLYQMTHSAVMLGLVGIVSFVPVLLLSTVGGLAADNLNRKKLLLATQALLAVLALGLSIATISGVTTPLMIFAFIACNFSVMAFFGPVRQSIIPDLVPKSHLMNAIGLNTLARQAAVVVGPAIGGFLIALYGVGGIYVFNTLALMIMMLTIWPLKIPAHHETMRSSFTFASVLEGIRFVRNSRIILSTMLLDFAATFFGSATSLLPIFAADILRVDERGLGLLYAATSAGAIIAGFTLASLKKLRHQGRVILWSVTVYGLATIGFGLSRSFYLTLFLLAVVGAGDMISTILRNTIRQTMTPRNMRGRMVGINILFAQGGPKLGDAEAGFLAAATSAPFSAVAGGIGTVLATVVIAAFHPRLRKFRDTEVMVGAAGLEPA